MALLLLFPGFAIKGRVWREEDVIRDALGRFAKKPGGPLSAIQARILADLHRGGGSAPARSIRSRTRQTLVNRGLLRVDGDRIHLTDLGVERVNLDAAARQRKRDEAIAEALPVSGILGEVEELLVDGEASPQTLKTRIESAARRLKVPDRIRDELLAAADAPDYHTAVMAALDRITDREGLEKIGATGQVARFNRSLHEAIDGRVRDGAPVYVIRPGHRYVRDGEPVRLEKARVEEISEQEFRERSASAASSPAAAAPAPAADPVPDAKAIRSGVFRGLRRISGQEGSHPGGVYEAADGSRWYVKAAPNIEHARSEAFAAGIYRQAGLQAPEVWVAEPGNGVADLGDTPQVASRIVPNSRRMLPSDLESDQVMRELREGFIVDAWLANWDVAGHLFSNIVIDKNGTPHRIDTGGALAWRALGEPKGKLFDTLAFEWSTLRDPDRSPYASQLFQDLTIDELNAAWERVQAVDLGSLLNLAGRHKVPRSLVDKLEDRRKSLKRRLDEEILDLQLAVEKGSGPNKAFEARIGKAASGQSALDAAALDVENRETFERAQLPDLAAALEALENYRADSDDVNRFLREGRRHFDENWERIWNERARLLDQAIDASPLDQDVQVWRGMALKDVFGPDADDARDLTGFTWRDKAYTSTTANQRIAKSFATPTDAYGRPIKGVMMRVLLPKGAKAVRLSGMDVPGEAELLVARGSTFRVVADHGDQLVYEASELSGSARGWNRIARVLDVELVVE